MPLFLGLDCGTQGLTAILLDAGPPSPGASAQPARIVFARSLEFDRDFPGYGTDNGVHRHADGLTVTAPPLLWAAALDRMLGLVASSGCDISAIEGICGSAQQHGTVYLTPRAARALGALDAARPVAPQIAPLLSRPDAPVWMDESTRAQCDAIDAALGGPDATARLTGSAATERFAGPQIRKFVEQQPDAYEATGLIHLVSSFFASLLTGAHAPIEPGDGAGMNLMDIVSCDWSPAALAATAPRLRERLPPIRPSWTIAGPLAPYWRHRHGLPAARVVAWSGDNPCSLVGTGLVREGDLGISLGTSDTVFAYRAGLPPHGSASHIFGSPTGGYMGLVCFRNGSLAREAIRDRFALDWQGFSSALRSTAAGSGGGLMLPWFDPEITPRAHAGVRTVKLDPRDASANVRAVVEGQMIAMANHSRQLSGHCRRIVATGGASSNREILQIMADVFEAEVYQGAGGNAACLGAALRAWHACALDRGHELSWDQIVAGITDPPPTTRVTPIAAHVEVYRDMSRRYAEFERNALGGYDRF